MRMLIAICVTGLLFGCGNLKTSGDGGSQACYNSDNQVDSTYKSPYECKSGGGTWR
jgi:hypothetical protein